MGTCGLAWGPAGRAEESAPSAAAAQGTIKDQPGKDQPDKDQSSPPAGPPAQIEGFRQARFGMNEEQVRQAIRKDFPGAATRLTVAIHPSEKTTVLSLSVTDHGRTQDKPKIDGGPQAIKSFGDSRLPRR